MKKSVIYAIVTGLLAIMIFAGPAAAFAPQPEPPYIGKLGSINNQVSAIDSKVNAAILRMGIEPSPFIPIVNQLKAEDHKLNLLYTQVDEVLVAIDKLGVAEDPSIQAALGDVLEGVNAISLDVQTKLDNLGDMDPKEAVPYLYQIQYSADDIADLIEPYVYAGHI